MTDRFVYTLAVDALADMEHREVVAQLALDAVRAEKKRLIDFLDLYEHFEARGEDQAGAKGEEPEAPASAAPANEAGAVSSTASADQSTGASQERAQIAIGVGTGGNNLGPASRSSAEAKTGVPAERETASDDQGQAPGDGQSQHDSGVRVAPVDTPIPPATVAQTDRGNGAGEQANAIATPSTSPAGSDAVAIPATNPPEEVAETTGTDRGAGESPASQEATGKSAGPSDSAAPTLKELIRPVHLAHPDWTGNQIADHIERPRSSVKAVLVTVRRELREAAQSPQETEERPEAIDTPEAGPDAPPTSPEPVAAIQPRPLFRRPIFEVGDDGEDDVETSFPVPKPKPAKRTKFYLRQGHGEGKYLHMSCVGLVPGKTYAWTGTKDQLLKVRQKFPDTRDLVEEPAQPAPAARV